MPAKRAIFLERLHPQGSIYRYVLWADVPSGNQLAYRNPSAESAYKNATPTELQAIRDGLVAEKAGVYRHDSASIATIQTWLEAEWTNFQNQVTAEVPWADYGRNWDGTTWQASPGVPAAGFCGMPEGQPGFIVMTGSSGYAANKFHFVLHNGVSQTLGQAVSIRVRLVVHLPGQSAVTGVAPSVFTFRRREAPTTAPSGTGGLTIGAMDSAYLLPTGIAAYNAPGTPPGGGTTTIINEYVPQADEAKLSTLDAPTESGIMPWGGQIVYKCSDVLPARPLTIRAGQTAEIQQGGTGGTGNGRILCLFTVG